MDSPDQKPVGDSVGTDTGSDPAVTAETIQPRLDSPASGSAGHSSAEPLAQQNYAGPDWTARQDRHRQDLAGRVGPQAEPHGSGGKSRDLPPPKAKAAGRAAQDRRTTTRLEKEGRRSGPSPLADVGRPIKLPRPKAGESEGKVELVRRYWCRQLK